MRDMIFWLNMSISSKANYVKVFCGFLAWLPEYKTDPEHFNSVVSHNYPKGRVVFFLHVNSSSHLLWKRPRMCLHVCGLWLSRIITQPPQQAKVLSTLMKNWPKIKWKHMIMALKHNSVPYTPIKIVTTHTLQVLLQTKRYDNQMHIFHVRHWLMVGETNGSVFPE